MRNQIYINNSNNIFGIIMSSGIKSLSDGDNKGQRTPNVETYPFKLVPKLGSSSIKNLVCVVQRHGPDDGGVTTGEMLTKEAA